MKKTMYYTYLGSNGIVNTPVLLEGIYHIKKYTLVADCDKVLTRDGINFYKEVDIAEKDLVHWYEIVENGQM
jgi:hypothetical protein